MIYYLDHPSPIRAVSKLGEAEEFGRERPGGLLLVDLESLPEEMKPFVRLLKPLLREETALPEGAAEGFVVTQFSK